MQTFRKIFAKLIEKAKKVPLVCASICFALFLSACSSPTTAEHPTVAQSKTEIVLRVLVWADEYDYVSAVAEAYNMTSNGITVQVVAASNDSYEDNLEDYLNGTASYDLVVTKGIAKTIQLSTEGFLLDITDYVKDSISDNSIDISNYGNMFNDITYKGRYYAFPTRTTCWALFYNKDIFDQAGIPYPQQMTWNQYAELAQALTNPENGIYGGYFLPWLPSCLALQGGSYLSDDDLVPLRGSFEFLNNLYTSGSHVSYYEMEEIEDPPEDVYNVFESGRIAMVANGEWMVNILLSDEYSRNSAVNWDIAPMPILSGQESNTTWGQYQYMGICSSSKYPDEAYNFLSFLCGKRGAEIYANSAIISAYSDDDIKASYIEASRHESTGYFFEARKIQEQLPIQGYQELIVSCRNAADNYFAGTITLDEAISQFSSERASIFGNNG